MALVFSTIGGGIGWWLGGFVGFMTAYMLGVVGSGIGWYVGVRIYQDYLS